MHSYVRKCIQLVLTYMYVVYIHARIYPSIPNSYRHYYLLYRWYTHGYHVYTRLHSLYTCISIIKHKTWYNWCRLYSQVDSQQCILFLCIQWKHVKYVYTYMYIIFQALLNTQEYIHLYIWQYVWVWRIGLYCTRFHVKKHTYICRSWYLHMYTRLT